MRNKITAAQTVMAGLAFIVAILVAGPLAQAQDLVWNTFMGSSVADYGKNIAVDASGNVYVTGTSYATWGSPVRAFAGDVDAFVAKLDSSGNLVWNTFLGSANIDYGYGIAVDASGNVYVTGMSYATWGSPVRAFAGGSNDAYVAKLNSSGTLVWNTFLGPASGGDFGYGIAVDASGNVYVTGISTATWGSPVRAFAGDADAFVAKLNSSGNLVWNTFLGSVVYDDGKSIAVDASGDVYVTGYSDATWGSPIRAFAGGADAFVAKLNSSGTLVWSTFLGSASAGDYGYGIAIDASGNVYVTGYSYATWGSPIRAFAGGGEAFVAKLNSSGNLVWNTFLGSAGGDYGYGIAVNASGNVYVTGDSNATWGSPVRAFAGGGWDAFVAKLSQPCEKDADCTDDVFCNGPEQCEVGECIPGEPPLCPDDAPVCDEENKECVGCLDASDCANDDLYCTGDPVCTDTICGFADDPCEDDTPVCDEDNNSCVECLLNEHCPAGYACIDSVCRVGGTVRIDKATVKAGKTGNSDSITFSGLLDASEADLDVALEIIVTIKAEDIPDPGVITFTFPISEYYFSKGKYKSPKDKTDPVLNLQLDTIKGTMKFSAKNADLTGLSCPITVMIEIGEYFAETELDEYIVNGPKKLCPIL